MQITRRSSASWTGGLRDGKGAITTQSGALSSYPYGFGSRFKGLPGTNPEELLGAAYAGCFTMALSLILSDAGLAVDKLVTIAEIVFTQTEGHFAITQIQLTLTGKVPGTDQETFQELAEEAKSTCPVSRILKPPVSLLATLVD